MTGEFERAWATLFPAREREASEAIVPTRLVSINYLWLVWSSGVLVGAGVSLAVVVLSF